MKVLITGASSGIGRQLALDYASEGCQVLAFARRESALEALAETESNIEPWPCDLTDPKQITEAMAKLKDSPPDLVIHGAGACEYVDMPDFNAASLNRVYEINIMASHHLIEALIPILRGTGARLAVISSCAGWFEFPRAEAYGASKAALNYLTHTLRISLAPLGIQVSLICPGFVKTPMTAKNDFPMPFLLEPQDASRRIRKGLAHGKKEIHFPRRLTWTLKLLAMLPLSLRQALGKKMLKQQSGEQTP